MTLMVIIPCIRVPENLKLSPLFLFLTYGMDYIHLGDDMPIPAQII